jgi:hypothetical protein
MIEGPLTTREARWWPIGLVACAIACWALYATLPPSPDQFEFDYAGWRVLEGDVLYRDLIDMNWPGPVWLHVLSTALFGNHLWSWRVLDFALLLLCCPWLAGLVAAVSPGLAPRLAVLFCLLFYAGSMYWMPGQPDMSAGAFLLGTLWCHQRAYAKGLVWQVGTGVTLALAMLNKPTLGVLGALLPVQALMARQAIGGVVRHTVVAGTATIAALLLALAATCLHGASLAEVLEATYTYNVGLQFVEVLSWPKLFEIAAVVHWTWWRLWGPAGMLGLGWLLLRKRSSLGGTALPLLWIAGMGSFLVQRKSYQYHLTPCFFALIGGLAVGIAAINVQTFPRQGATLLRRVQLAAIGLVALAAATRLWANYGSLARALAGGSYAQHLEHFSQGDGLSVADARALAERMERTVPADRSVLVFGEARSMNFLARRRQPTRFFYSPVLVTIDRAVSVTPLPMTTKWLAWLDGDLLQNEPYWCLISSDSATWLAGKTPAASRLRNLLANYRTAGTIGTLTLYERR